VASNLKTTPVVRQNFSHGPKRAVLGRVGVNTIIDSVQQEDSGEGDACVRVERTYIKDRPNVGRTVKKSIAAIASRWFRRKVSQRLARSGSLGALFIQREMVLSTSQRLSNSRNHCDSQFWRNFGAT
jgi:hypothetical protein